MASRTTLRGRALRRSPLAALAAAALLALPAGGASATGMQPLFELGRVGGNIAPFSVRILPDGTVGRSGPVRLADPGVQLSKARLATLLRYARTEHFWTLRRRTICRGELPDAASFFVTVHTSTRTRTVTVRGGCSTRFTRIYRALAAAATVRP